MVPGYRRASSSSGARLTAVALAAAVSLLLPATAVADPVSDARTAATRLRVRVEKLQTKAEVAAEAYDRAQSSLDSLLSQYIEGERVLEQAQKQADADRELVAGRVVALYESGGPLAMYAGVMDGGTINDMYDRVSMAGAVVAGDQSVMDRSSASLHQVDVAQQRLAALQDQQRQLESVAGQRADAARSATDEAQAALASADQNVQALIAEQQAAAARAAAEDFARRVAAAQAAAARAAAASGAGPATPIVGASPAAMIAINAARSVLGVPYVWGATGPDTFDCSGLTGWAYAHAGIHLPRVAADQFNFGRHVAINELQPGDLVYWATDVNQPSTIHHVAIYIGNGRMIAAPHTGAFVREEAMFSEGYIGATRPTG